MQTVTFEPTFIIHVEDGKVFDVVIDWHAHYESETQDAAIAARDHVDERLFPNGEDVVTGLLNAALQKAI